MSKGGSVIFRIYFALVSFVTLMMIIFSVSSLLTLGLKTYVFTAADGPEYSDYCELEFQTQEECDKRQSDQWVMRKQQEAVRDIAMLIISAPLFWLHFRVLHREMMEGGMIKKKKEEKK